MPHEALQPGSRSSPSAGSAAPAEVVVAQRPTWPGTPAVAVATRFAVRDGLITRIERHDELAAALAAGGLTDADEVPKGSAADPSRGAAPEAPR